MTPDSTTHDCPGGCGKQVKNYLYSCAACWLPLPPRLKEKILETAKLGLMHPARMAALSLAESFYLKRKDS